MAIFGFMPLQLRYATEARPYAQAVCLAVFCTLAFLYSIEEVTPLRCVFYLGTAIAGLYTQPFSFFVPLGHWIWLVASSKSPERRKLLPVLSGLLLASSLAFLPWYLYARQFWRKSVDAGQFHFVFGWKELFLLAHELVDAGYLGTALIVFLCIYGLSRGKLTHLQKLLWTVLLTAPFIGAIAADAFFGYFVAIRQFIFIVPALAFVAAIGVQALYDRKPLFGASVLLALAAAWFIGDVKWFTKPREDWRVQAAALETKLSTGGCVIFVPSGAEPYFSFFNPRLKDLQCPSSSLPENIWLAVSPYDAETTYSALVKQLDRSGFIHRPSTGSQRPRLEQFEYSPTH